MHAAYPINANWWESFQEPHPVPHRFDATSELTTPRERAIKERELANKVTRIQNKIRAATVRSGRERTRMSMEVGNPAGHAMATCKFIKTLNNIISYKEELEALKLQSEE